MIGLAFKATKLLFFVAAVLVMGHLVRWEGRSLSDRVGEKVGVAQRSQKTEATPSVTSCSIPLSPSDQVRESKAHPIAPKKGSSQRPDSTPGLERQELIKVLAE